MSPHDLLGVEDLGDVLLGWGFFTSLPAILAIAFLAARLLGVRRSWTTAVASGLAGWLAGTGLSLVIARSEDGAGFTRNVWLFSTFFAMSASVWIELLAKPGALARAQTGILSVPRPLRALRRKSARLNRYVQIPASPSSTASGRSSVCPAATKTARTTPPAPAPAPARRPSPLACAAPSRSAAGCSSSWASSSPLARTCCRPRWWPSFPGSRTTWHPPGGRRCRRWSRPSWERP